MKSSNFAAVKSSTLAPEHMNTLSIIDKYYPIGGEQRILLLRHSWQVAGMALRCAAAHPELHLDRALLLRGALLHDIGIFATHAPSIHCHGELPYLMHGFVGAQLLRALGLEAEARICERHTGTGLTRHTVVEHGLNVEPIDYLPETTEEKLVCYADKFYSKSRPAEELTFEQAHASLLRFGTEGAARFAEWHRLFGVAKQ